MYWTEDSCISHIAAIKDWVLLTLEGKSMSSWVLVYRNKSLGYEVVFIYRLVSANDTRSFSEMKVNMWRIMIRKISHGYCKQYGIGYNVWISWMFSVRTLCIFLSFLSKLTFCFTSNEGDGNGLSWWLLSVRYFWGSFPSALGVRRLMTSFQCLDLCNFT
jgi:hypothetical protein